ncbi:RNA-guided endonuclease InsQ/TnpB family protein [Spirosoma utsteinense]|uniref:IS605 OrfB family transposase n=1 Tax=Spirosoma utsteinense TaxID=2585773 RepID=A0ABR6W1J4_9BACT|nr:RNA-guided endonuclease TnpB family protein [Spirosoma utsteinense]MBC3788121.1 IS605 OrfB family transposase [Spirosoma utsteinense]MBC3790018.1 IS605 OrfB family transposase [Spirosoma utsteinense]
MNLTTLSYRIKDETAGKHLIQMSYSCTFVWNFCNQSNAERWAKFGKTFTAFDLNKLTAGCAKDLGLHSQTVQAVAEEYAKCCKQFKRVKLNWRSRKKSLGWIPFKASGIKIEHDSITYGGRPFRFWLSRPIGGRVRFGSFAQDSKGHWFVNLVVEKSVEIRTPTGKECGIDLGLKTLATLSDGVELSRENLTRQYEVQLARAQRARKKKRVTAIHTKIKNKRKDWNHKATTRLVREYDRISVGNVSSSNLKKTRMAKSVSDAGWADFKLMLSYKSIGIGTVYTEVNESFSTVTCSSCKARSGPRGQAGLGVREWVCVECGSRHNRDQNAAKNILWHGLPRILRTGHCTPLRESPRL